MPRSVLERPPRLIVGDKMDDFQLANLLRATVEYIYLIYKTLETEGALDALVPDVTTAQEDIDTHAARTDNPHAVTATQVTFTPTGDIASVTVQGAIAEVSSETLRLAGGTMTGLIVFTATQTFDGRDLSIDGAKLDGIETLADVTDTANVDAAGAVMESDFDAQTILLAVADDTPLPITIAASSFVGRKAAGDAGTMTVAEALTLLNVEAGADVTDAANVRAAGASMRYETAVGQGALAAAGQVVLVDSSGSEQYKISEIYLSGAGTNFSGGGGDRDLDITDGTAVYATIPAATLQALAAGRWGDAGVPFPASAADLTAASAAGVDIVAQYSGGTTDYTAGSCTIVIVAERTA